MGKRGPDLGLFSVALVLLAFAALMWVVVSFKWKECRKVGHSATYCAITVGR